jgi:D-glycero-D-manno-heptose 1,7-bisphosphate phosphatase
MKAVFFDRDDTIIYNIPYNGDPSQVKLMPGAKESLQKLKKAGFELFIASNQSAVGRGMIQKKDVNAVNTEMLKQLEEKFFKKIYVCYSAPEDPYNDRRKPSPMMLFEARDEYGIDLEKSFMVGDRLADVLCGKNAGCKSILVLGKEGSQEEREQAKKEAHFIAQNLLEAADWILKTLV